jgi:hypothetical protein
MWFTGRLVGLAVTLLATTVFAEPARAAEPALADALRRCLALGADAEKLACFERLARALPAAAGGTAAPGRWEVAASPGAAGRRTIVAEQRPLEPWGEESVILQVVCRDDRVGIAVRRDSLIANSSAVFTTIRINERLVPSDPWTAASDYRSVSYPGPGRDFLATLPETGRLFVRLEGSRRWRFEGTYQLDGIAGIRDGILAACRS